MTETASKSEVRKTKNFYSKLAKGINDYQLIQEGDRILVGVSGGKDSMSLLSGLATRLLYRKEKYSLVAAHIDVENVPYSIDRDYIASFCKKYDIEFIIDTINVEFNKDSSKSQCFLCSWNRRKRLFELSEKYKCNKIALGHHLDDAVETLLINMCYHACISSMPASLKMFGGQIELIRPMILLTNKEILDFAKVQGFPTEKETCPWDDKTKRNQAKEIIAEMEKRFKPARKGLFKSMSKIQTDYLPVESGKNPIVDGLNISKKKHNNKK